MCANRWRLVLDGYKFPSLNTLMRMHWAVRKKRQDELMSVFEYLIEEPLPVFKGMTRLTITRQWGKRGRAYDPDNLAGSCKMLIDCLKCPKGRSEYGLGIIPDDDPSHIELLVKQEKSADGIYRAIIEMENLGEKDV